MKLILISLASIAALASISCREKTTGEKIGDSIDSTVEEVKDAVNPKGPGEKVGEKIDKALGR